MTTNQAERPTWGEGVRWLRTLRDMTQVQLAEAAGVSQAHISAIEADASPRVSDAVRVRIARALEVDPHDLFPYREGVAS